MQEEKESDRSVLDTMHKCHRNQIQDELHLEIEQKYS
jgi:hypothetical protein